MNDSDTTQFNDNNHNNNIIKKPCIIMQSPNDLRLYQKLYIDNTTQYISTLLSEQCGTLNEKQKKIIIKILVETIKQFGVNIVNSIEPNVFVQPSVLPTNTSSDSTSSEWQRLIRTKDDILNMIELINNEMPQHLTQISSLTQYLTDEQHRTASSIENTLKSVNHKQSIIINDENNNESNHSTTGEVRNSSKLAARFVMQQL